MAPTAAAAPTPGLPTAEMQAHLASLVGPFTGGLVLQDVYRRRRTIVGLALLSVLALAIALVAETAGGNDDGEPRDGDSGHRVRE